MSESNSTISYKTISRLPGYCFGDDGSVWKLENSAWIKIVPKVRPFGHLWFTIKKVGAQNIHRLILEAFVGPCPAGMECCHRDGNPANNNLSNLRWDTHSNNMADCKRTKLNLETAIKIREELSKANGHITFTALAKKHGVGRSTIYDLLNHKTWSQK